MNKQYIIVPNFGTSHDVYFSKIAKEKNLLEYSRFKGKFSVNNFTFYELSTTIFIWLTLLPKITILYLIRNDIRNIKCEEVNIGFSTNEWCVAQSKNGTPNFFLILRYTLKSILVYRVLKSEFVQKKIGFVLGTSEPYPFNSISCQLGKIFGVPVKEIRGIYSLIAFDYNSERLSSTFEQIFTRENLNAIKKEHLLVSEENFKSQINSDRRFIHYMTNSNDTKSEFDLKNHIVIYCHDFYDAPGLWGGNVFQNHYAWIEHTVRYLIKKKVNVALKLHPNQRKGNKSILFNLKRKFENIKLLMNDVSLVELKKLEILGIITVYGTVQFEAAYLGIPVICACDLRYINVCNYSTSISEYQKNLNNLIDNTDIFIADRDSLLRSFYLYSKYFLFSIPSEDKVELPFDDIPKSVWAEVFQISYPEKMNERREVFLRSEKFKKYLEKKLEKINLHNVLGI